MKTIWKFPIAVTDEQNVMVPDGARWLHLQVQHGALTLWALCNPDMPQRSRVIRVIGTGHPIPDAASLEHIGTVFDGALVWHVFEKTP